MIKQKQDQKKLFAEKSVLNLVVDVSEQLMATHAKRIAHGKINSNNILFLDDDHLKLLWMNSKGQVFESQRQAQFSAADEVNEEQEFLRDLEDLAHVCYHMCSQSQ